MAHLTSHYDYGSCVHWCLDTAPHADCRRHDAATGGDDSRSRKGIRSFLVSWWVYPLLMAQTVVTGICTVCKSVSRRLLIRLDGRKLIGWGAGAVLMPVLVSGILSSGLLHVHHILDVNRADDFAEYGTLCSLVYVVCSTAWRMIASRW